MSVVMNLIIFSTVSVSLAVCIVLEPQDFVFSKKPICHVQERLATSGCVLFASEVRSLVECLSLCNTEYTSCTGASVTKSSLCLLYTTCSVQKICTEEIAASDHDYFSKVVCNDDGVWDPLVNTCQCKNGLVGTKCETLPKSCNDLIDHGYPSAWYNVTLDLSEHRLPNTQVYCYIESVIPTYSFVSVMKNKGKIDNAKKWTTYRDGFVENPDSQLWLGLEKWHVLSQAGYGVLSIRADFEMPDIAQVWWTYKNFMLSGQSEKYSFVYESASTTRSTTGSLYLMEDCFADLQNVSFSTFDNDNDLESIANCAQERGSGWWFSVCDNACNLLGWNWRDGYNVSYARRITLKGIDMQTKGAQVVNVEMFLMTPE